MKVFRRRPKSLRKVSPVDSYLLPSDLERPLKDVLDELLILYYKVDKTAEEDALMRRLNCAVFTRRNRGEQE